MDKQRDALVIATLIGALAAPLGAATPASAASPNVCRLTALNLQAACQSDARGDHQVALANCQNRTDAVVREACRRAARQLQDAAQADCRAQLLARQDACGNLGPAAYAPVINPADFVAGVNNPYFPLTPGTTFIYERQTAEGLERVEFAVTHRTKVILGVTCIEVRDIAILNGVLIEDTLDWFAQDQAGNVWYFGENTHELEDGLIVNIDGTWTGGVDDAQPGIIMPAQPAVGDFYRQEFSLDNAEDLAEVLSRTEAVSVPFGSFTNCVKTEDITPLSPDAIENKYYAPGVGQVLTVHQDTGERSELKQIIIE